MVDRTPAEFTRVQSSAVVAGDWDTVWALSGSEWRRKSALVNYFTEAPGTAAENAIRIQAMLNRGGYIKFTKAANYPVNAALTGSIPGTIVDLGGAVLTASGLVGTDILNMGTGVNDGPFGVIADGGGLDGKGEAVGGIILGGTGPLSRFAKGVTVVNCAAKIAIQINSGDHASEAGRLHNCYITDCVIDNCLEGMHMSGVDHWIVANNVVSNITAQDGFEPINTRWGNCHDNIFIDANELGNSTIDLFGNSGQGGTSAYIGNKDVLVHSNTISYSIPWTLQSSNAQAITIGGETDTLNQRISVYNNTINGTFNYGVRAFGNSVINEDLCVYNNVIDIGDATGSKANYQGISFGGGVAFNVQRCTGNTVILNPLATVSGITYCIGALETPSDRIVIADNILKTAPASTGAESALVYFNQPALNKNNWVKDNIFYAADQTAWAIWTQNVSLGKVVITGNDFTASDEVFGTTIGTGLGGLVSGNGPQYPILYAKDNFGYQSTTFGAATILGNDTDQSVTVTHGLGGCSSAIDNMPVVPIFVTIIADNDPTGAASSSNPRAASKNDTTFALSITTTTANPALYVWKADAFITIEGTE